MAASGRLCSAEGDPGMKVTRAGTTGQAFPQLGWTTVWHGPSCFTSLGFCFLSHSTGLSWAEADTGLSAGH